MISSKELSKASRKGETAAFESGESVVGYRDHEVQVRNAEDSLDLVEEAFRLFGCADLVEFVDAHERAVTMAVQVGCYLAREVTEL